jgi:hypothetical protein
LITYARYPLTVSKNILELPHRLGALSVLAMASRQIPAGIENFWVVGSQHTDQVRQERVEIVDCRSGIADFDQAVGDTSACLQRIRMVSAKSPLLVGEDSLV